MLAARYLHQMLVIVVVFAGIVVVSVPTVIVANVLNVLPSPWWPHSTRTLQHGMPYNVYLLVDVSHNPSYYLYGTNSIRNYKACMRKVFLFGTGLSFHSISIYFDI